MGWGTDPKDARHAGSGGLQSRPANTLTHFGVTTSTVKTTQPGESRDMTTRTALLIGGDETKERLRKLSQQLRALGIIPTCYFGDDIADIVNDANLYGTLVVICLSSASRTEGSATSKQEQQIIRKAVENGSKICVMPNRQGEISAPYLAELGSHISFVVDAGTNGESGCSAGDLCSKAQIIEAREMCTEAVAIATSLNRATQEAA